MGPAGLCGGPFGVGVLGVGKEGQRGGPQGRRRPAPPWGAAAGRPLKPSGGRFALRAVSLHCGRGVRGAVPFGR